MKIRCKVSGSGGGGGGNRTLPIDLPDSPAATIADLLAALASSLGVPAAPDAVTLSLNGRDPVPLADPAALVTSLGLVSGDLLYVRCGTGIAPAWQAPASRPPGTPHSASLLATDAAASTTTAGSLRQSFVSLPILVGECGGASGRGLDPHSRQQQLCPSLALVLRLYGDRGSSQLHRLALALHCLMVETGFVSVDPNSGEPHRLTHAGIEEDPVVAANRVLTKYLLPTDFGSLQTAFPSIRYRYSLAPLGADVLLKVVNAGGSRAICHCCVWAVGEASEAICSVSADYILNKFVSPHGYENLRQLSVLFKDSVSVWQQF